jgi:ABC-type nitrate/sulfonate/bicarbonate transport system ATPase subunit
MNALPAHVAPLEIKDTRRPDVVDFFEVTKRFGDKLVLDKITFKVADLPDKGELVAIVGTSGCGKSTLAKIIAGIAPHFPHTEGKAISFDKPITGPSIDRGIVDQRYSLLPHLTVLDNIAFGLRLAGMKKRQRRDQAREWIGKIGLEGSETKYPHELSGGMQQRVAIASTLILKPRIVLMDEPFGALDPMIRVQMQDLLIELWEAQESTIFFITHSAEEAVYLGDRVFRMTANPGRIVEKLEFGRPEKKLAEMRKDKNFADHVAYLLLKLEERHAEPRGEIAHAAA